MSDALPNNPSPQEADADQPQESAAPKLSLEDQLDALLVNIDKVEPGILQAAGVEVPDVPEEKTETQAGEDAAEATDESAAAVKESAEAAPAAEQPVAAEEPATAEPPEPVAEVPQEPKSIDEQLKAMLTTPAEFDPPETIPSDPAPAATDEAIEQIDDQLATEADAAVETPAADDDAFSMDSLESALDQMIEQASTDEAQAADESVEPATIEAQAEAMTEEAATDEPAQPAVAEAVEAPADTSAVEAILDQVDQADPQADAAAGAKPDPLQALAEIAGDEEDDDLVAQLDELLSETVAAPEADQPEVAEAAAPDTDSQPELAQAMEQPPVIDEPTEAPAAEAGEPEAMIDETIAGDFATPDQIARQQDDAETENLEPAADQPAAAEPPSEEPAAATIDGEIAGDMLTPEQLVAQQQDADQAPAAQDEPLATDVAAGETHGDDAAEEQSVSDIDAQLAMEADDAIAGDFETPEQVAAAEMADQQAFSDDSAVPPAPAEKPPLVAPANSSAAKEPETAEAVDDHSTVKSPVEKPAGFVAERKDVARELDEQPEQAAASSAGKDQPVADAPSVTGQAVPSIFGKNRLLQIVGMVIAMIAGILQRTCALLDQLTLARLPGGIRDMVGYAALITIFNAMVLFLYILFIK